MLLDALAPGGRLPSFSDPRKIFLDGQPIAHEVVELVAEAVSKDRVVNGLAAPFYLRDWVKIDARDANQKRRKVNVPSDPTKAQAPPEASEERGAGRSVRANGGRSRRTARHDRLRRADAGPDVCACKPRLSILSKSASTTAGVTVGSAASSGGNSIGVVSASGGGR